ncbi:MAG: DUF2442 domain-containing protein, partial [Fusobacteriaceae bacterium]
MGYPKIKNVKALENYKLEILFHNGVTKIYDFTPNFEYEVFQALKEYNLFKEVVVDPGGYGISWNDDLDMSEYELWTKGIEIK